MERTILAVDDDPMYIDLVTDVAASQHYSVISAPDGAIALHMLTSHRVDLIVSDVDMPVMDGLAFHAKVRNDPRFSSLPFVFLTGTTNPKALAYITDHTDIRHIPKANLVTELTALLERLRDRCEAS
jgi:CheY-like chemotaxis protein